MSMDDEQQQQQQIPIAFSQQVICNPKVLLIQGKDHHSILRLLSLIHSMQNTMTMKNN